MSGEDRVQKSEEEWRKQLTEDQFCITRQHGTERAFANKYWDHHEPGVYKCVCCGQPLFGADDKFDSGTGWPSFTQPLSSESVGTSEDNQLFVKRTEVHCSKCDAHLGHVFPDGPKPTGLRYCLNSAALTHEKEKSGD